MFMVKDEISNIKSLVRVKMKTNRKNLLWFLAIAAFMYLSSLAAAIYVILRDDGIRHYSSQDYSVSFFFGLVIAYVIIMILYRRNADYLAVFPQTNTSRFVSSQIISYLMAVFVGLAALILHLICYSVIEIISLSVENVYIALGFDLGFIITGFLSYLAYCFLLIAAIDLVGAALRKWGYYAVAVLLAIVALAFVDMAAFSSVMLKGLSLLISEESFGWFMVKAAGLWLVITAVSLVINKFTIYHKSSKAFSNSKTVIVCIAAALVSMLVVGIILFSAATQSFDSHTNASMEQRVDDYFSDFYAGSEEIRIDVSHLPKGSSIKIEAENIGIIAEGAAVITGSAASSAFLGGVSALDDIQGDTVVIRFRPPFFHVNGVDLTGYANAQITASLVGDTIYMKYSIDDACVVILPVWSFAGQFSGYREKGLVSQNTLGFSSGGTMNANVHIDVE